MKFTCLNRFECQYRVGQEGPLHDPYGYVKITVLDTVTKNAYVFKESGFSGATLTLFAPDGSEVRCENIDRTQTWWQRRCRELKLRLLAKRHVGCEPDEVIELAQEMQYRMSFDPMGPLSRYI